ncbi:uncharacterized protein LOC135843187 [Planococcus citri]|uniref:uncharacterized protein LOC135843187 n=1 Tax=Planococcus citri TaxID=170843 RepID=UPI0031F7AA21
MTVSENLKFLENYLSERSYIEGYQPSQADVLVLTALKSAPTKATPNIYRWYTHIQSFNADEKKKFAQKSLNSEVAKFLDDKPSSAAAAAMLRNLTHRFRSSVKCMLMYVNIPHTGKWFSPSFKFRSIAAAAGDDDDDVDLFGSDEDDAEAERIKEERLKAYAEKKSKKPAVIAKSSIVSDVKPRDDETDMKAMETQLECVKMEDFRQKKNILLRTESNLSTLGKEFVDRYEPLLGHATVCKSVNCGEVNCRTLKSMMVHPVHCESNANGRCRYCLNIFILYVYHSERCKNPDCLFTVCRNGRIRSAYRRYEPHTSQELDRC